MSDAPEVQRPVPNPPEIFMYTLAGQYACATVSRLMFPGGANVGDRYRTQLVLARDVNELNGRLIAVLVQQYGMTQGDAMSLVPSGVTTLVPMAQERGDA